MVPCESTAEEVHLNGHNKNASTESKIRTSNKINSTSEITHEEVSFEWLHNKISSHNQKLELQAK